MSDDSLKRILEYGNTFYGLFFKSETIKTKSGQELNLTRLYIDDKLTLFGNSATNYDLVTKDNTIISEKYTHDGTYVGSLCDIVGETDNKKCLSCFTSHKILEGDTYTIRIFHANGNLIGLYEVVAVKATNIIGKTDADVVVSFNASANQIDNDNHIVLYKNQAVNELVLYPTLTYANGLSEVVNIDGVKCIVYGLDQISTEIPGVSYKVQIKYFYDSDTNISPEIEGDHSTFIICEFDVFIRDKVDAYYSKLTPVLEYDYTNNKWDIKVFGYRTNDLFAPEYIEDATIVGFDGSANKFKEPQNVSITVVTDQLHGTTFSENFIITTFGPAYRYDTLNIKDNGDSERTYGKWTADKITAKLEYVSSANSGYYLLYGRNDIGETLQDQIDCFLHYYYWAANPPYDPVRISRALTPTHFTIRNTSGDCTALLESLVPIGEFQSRLDLIDGLAGAYVGKTLLLEFIYWEGLKDNDNNPVNEQILYGVPVVVKQYNV